MANLTFDFLHNYVTGERRASDPADAYQYDEGHVLEAVVPVAVTSCEIQYWIRGMEKADAYTPTSITQNTDNTYTILGNIPNSYFETNGDLRVYIVVTDGDASITTYEGYIHIKERQMPEDYVDDDPENEATRVLIEAQEAAATATAAAETCEEVLESIPEDYSTLSDDVSDLKDGLQAVEDDVADVKDEFNELALFGEYDVLKNIEWTVGSYLTNTGGTSSSGTSYLSNYVDITGIDKLYIKNKSSRVYRIAQYNSSKTYIADTYTNISSNSSVSVDIDSNAKYILVSIGDWSTLYPIDDLVATIELYGSNYVSKTRDIAEKNRDDVAEIQDELSAFDFTYNVPIDIEVSTGTFSKVGWTFYTTSWAESYRYTQMTVSAGEKYVASGFGNANAQFVMFFSGTPAEATYKGGVGTGSDGDSYTNYEVTVPTGATVMLVQSRVLTGVPSVSVSKKTAYTQSKALEGKMYWRIVDGELTVVSKYTDDSDFVVKFGKRGPNLLPDFKGFAICENESMVASDGSGAVNIIGDVTDWHSPFQVSAQSNEDGDNPTSYYYTGGNHNYNNQGDSGEGLATARNIYLVYYINGAEVECGAGYSDDIVAKWKNNVQGYNTTKSDGTGREILTETHELTFDGLKLRSMGFIEPLENVYITTYYGYQLYGLGSGHPFDTGIDFIGASNRGVYSTLTEAHESGNAECNGIEAIGSDHSLRLTVDTSYDLGRRTFYSGTQGCFNTQYRKAYTNLIKALSASSGNRYYSRAMWEFYPTNS